MQVTSSPVPVSAAFRKAASYVAYSAEMLEKIIAHCTREITIAPIPSQRRPVQFFNRDTGLHYRVKPRLYLRIARALAGSVFTRPRAA